MWEAIAGILVGLLVVYLVLLIALWLYARRHPESVSVPEALRLLPDLIRVIRRMAADKSAPPAVKIKLALLLVYLLSPVDLVPDFIPIIGQADDVIILALVLRSVIRSAGVELLHRHWPGTATGLSIIEKLAGTEPRSTQRNDDN
ncbi:YkvA family protein [Glutamicibacter sp.]|jgi:Uncharacterized conserved protein|uniref:YkvA family protein n=1 Tax=Glutamicibacter sp. TaxID=1931995 RepID=UPI002FD9C435